MAHPIIEALYMSMVATGVAQPVDGPRQVVIAPPTCIECSTAVRAPRVVYDWAAGSRKVYRTELPATLPDSPMVGINEGQVRRLTGLAVG